MSSIHSPSIIIDSLALNLDFANPKRFSADLGAGNLVQNWFYNSSTWASIHPANTDLETNIDAPDGQRNAVRVKCRPTGSSLFRVGFTAFTPNGTHSYNMSFWVRKISGTTTSTHWSDIHDTNNFNYHSQLITGKWVRISYSGVLTALSKSFIDLIQNVTSDHVLDFWGIKIENLSTKSTQPQLFKDTIGGNIFSAYNPEFLDQTDTELRTRRTMPATAEDGGQIKCTLTGELTYPNFAYNDHTMDIWFKPNSRAPTAYDGTEDRSSIVLYAGTHAGFSHTASTIQYELWGNIVNTYSVGAARFADTQVSAWMNLTAVRSGTTVYLYKNGILQTTSSLTITSAGVGTSNVLCLGAVNYGGSYSWHSDTDYGALKMYKKALSQTEITQNYNALRGRYGL